MKDIAGIAGLEGNFTNHSCKRTCANQLYQAGIDELEIMSRTNHWSEIQAVLFGTARACIWSFESSNLKKMKCETTMVEMSKSEIKREDILNPPSNSMVTRGTVQKLVFNNCVFHFKPWVAVWAGKKLRVVIMFTAPFKHSVTVKLLIAYEFVNNKYNFFLFSCLLIKSDLSEIMECNLSQIHHRKTVVYQENMNSWHQRETSQTMIQI